METHCYYIYHGDHFITYANIKSLCSTPDPKIILYVKYISIKNKTETDSDPEKCVVARREWGEGWLK